VVRAPDKQGISNLIDILAAIRETDPAEIEGEFAGSGYGDFKRALAEALEEHLAPIRLRYAELMGDPGEVDRLLAAGAERAIAEGRPTLAAVHDAIGLLPGRAPGAEAERAAGWAGAHETGTPVTVAENPGPAGRRG
jgi:tryptophanyl-tRNA synthetase